MHCQEWGELFRIIKKLAISQCFYDTGQLLLVGLLVLSVQTISDPANSF